MIDGVGQKYLNFAELNTGFLVGPGFNGGNGSIVNSMQLWTANDAEARDPASFEVYGTQVPLNSSGMLVSDFFLIASGALGLPSTRNMGGAAPLDPANSQTVTFANGTAYRNYLVLFPTVKDEPTANSMQIAEVQLFGVVPKPSTWILGAVGFAAFLLIGYAVAKWGNGSAERRPESHSSKYRYL